MREIIFDTETTGLNPREDRIIEIGAVELENRFVTGRTFHIYINPGDRQIHPDAQAIHGISNADLADKSPFKDVIQQWLDFTAGAKLIAHNANFDVGFFNAEFERLGFDGIDPDRVIDTLAIARRKHPMGPNSLDALCKRYGIDNTKRTLHGALLDSELLAEVYIELVGGKQAALSLDADSNRTGNTNDTTRETAIALRPRPKPLPSPLSDEDIAAHLQLVETLGEKAIWKKKTA